MPFDVDGAKKAGYSDDEIQAHLKSVYPKFDFDSARKAGYSLNEIASHLTQGGEKSNEDQKPSQPQAYQDRNAGRESDQQEPPVRSETGIQADGLLRPEDQSQRERNDQTRVSDEGQTQDAQGGIQGAQAGEGLEGQVSARDEKEVAGGVLPSPVEIASKAVEAGKNLVDFHIKAFPAIRDFGAAALSSIGQSLYGAGAGIARTEPEYIDLPSYGVKVKNPRYKESKELVDFFEKQKAGAAEFPEALGAKPLTGVEKTAAEVTGGLLKLPAQILTGPLGMGSLLAEAFGSSKEQFYQKAKQEGLSDEQAINKADFNATASTAAALPLYHVGGIGARIGAEKLVAETAPKLAKMATQFGLNVVANTVASAASRGITAALSGESITDAMKDVTVPGVIQDIAFAAHSSVTHFQEEAAKGNAKEAARDLSDPALEQVAQDPRYAEAVAPEVKARAESRMAQEAPKADLPETGKVLEVSSEAERAAAPEAPVEEQSETPKKTLYAVGEKTNTQKTFEKHGVEDDDFAKVLGYYNSKILSRERELNLVKEYGGSPEQIAEAEQKLRDAKNEKIDAIGDEGDVAARGSVASRLEAGTHEWVKGKGLVKKKPAEAPAEAQPTEPTPQGEREGEEEVAPLAAESAIEEAPSWRDMPDRPYGESVFVHDEKSAGTKQNPIIIGDQLFFKDKGIWNYKSTSIGGPFGKNEWLRMTDPKSSQKVEDWYQKYGKSKQSQVTAPQGARIASAAYLASDGNVYEGPDHISAMEKAKEAGAITQEEIDAKQSAEARNTDEFGFKVTMPDGTTQVTTREAAGQIAKKSGQVISDEFVHGDKMHSNEVRLDEFPSEEPKKRIGPGAAGIREFELRDIQQGAEIIKGYKDQTNEVMPYEDWKRNFGSTIYEDKYTEDQLKEFYDQSVRVADEASKGKPIPEAIQQLDIPITKTENATALKNAQIDEDRVNRGRPKLMSVARKDWGTAWENAIYKMDRDPYAQDSLISELAKNPRAVNDEEGAMLVHRLITKKNEFDLRVDKLEKGNLSPEEQAQLRSEIADLDDQIYGLEQLGRAVGTETARGLNFRKAMIANDYSLESMRTKVRAAKNGEKLTEEDESKLKNLSDEIKKNDDEVDRIQKEEKDKFSEEDTKEFINTAKKGSKKRKEKESPDDALARLKLVAEGRMEDYPKLASTIRKIAIAFVDKGITEREPLLDAVHGFLKDEVGMPESWTRQETSDAICQYGIFRTLSKDATMNAFRKINGQLLELGKRADILEGKAPKKTGMERAKPDVEARNIARENRKLIKKFNIKTEDPETQLAGALEGIKNKLKNEIEDLTARIKSGEQTPSRADAPTDAEIASLKELRSSLKAQFEIMYGKPEKAPPSHEEQVAAAEKAYAKLIEKKKDLLANQGVTDLTPRKPEVTSPKIEAQKAEIEQLNAELKAMRSADSVRNEERKVAEINRQIEAKKKQIQDQVIPKKGEKFDVASLERTKAVQELQALRDQIKSEDWYIAARQQAAIDSYVARQHKIANEYLRRIDEEDFAPRQKTERVLDSREFEAKAKAEQARAKFQKELAAYNYKNRTKEQKVLDFVVNFSRATMLSHLTTIGKLFAASLEIAALKPVKAAAGYTFRILPPINEIAKLSPLEGGGNPSQDVRLFVNGIVEGIKDFPNVVKSGQTKIDSLMKEKTRVDSSILEYAGHLHKAIKSPVFTGEFKTSLGRYLNWMEKQGMDIHDPINQKTAMDAAYQNAQRSIFSEDNALVNWINTNISLGKQSKSRGVRLASYALQYNIPIVKIPTNIMKQVLEAQFGAGIAGAKIVKAMVKGMDTLSPMEADTIMRQLKVGSIGLAMVAFGAMRPDMFGGFHLPGITEDDEDVPSGGAKIFGYTIPRIAFDNPLMIAAQVGATARKYWDAKAGEFGYKGEEAADFAMAMVAAELGMVKETPLFDLPRKFEEYQNVERLPENLGNIIASKIPGPIQDLAKALDTEEDGTLPKLKALIGLNKDIIKRKPDGSPPDRFLQTIEKNLPYFRKYVPEK